MEKYIIFTVASGNDITDLVLKVNYKLRDKNLLIIAPGKDAHLETYTRELELMGAKIKVTANPLDFSSGEWDAVLICGEDKFTGDAYKEIITKTTEKKTVLGLIGQSPVALTLQAAEHKTKKITMDKEVSSIAIQAGLNYTGKEVEVDGNIVTSTGFDKKIAKEFLASFVSSIAKKSD